MRRTTLVTVSIVGHLAIGIGLYASGAWKLEKLEHDFKAPGIGIMTPSMGGGGQQDLPKHEFKKKEKVEKKIAKDVQWDKRVETDKATAKVASEEPGDGEGEGPGKGPGPGGPGETGTCVLPPCGGEPVPEPVKLPDPPKLTPVPVSPVVMAALRISGETQIHPSNVVKQQMVREDNTRVVASIKVCIQASGAIGTVSMLGTTKYPAYDQQILETARRWRYRPHMVNGVATPACSAVNFVYSIK
jgi:TonB family protein